MLNLAEKFSEGDSQAIILTSQTREAELMKSEKGFNYILM